MELIPTEITGPVYSSYTHPGAHTQTQTHTRIDRHQLTHTHTQWPQACPTANENVKQSGTQLKNPCINVTAQKVDGPVTTETIYITGRSFKNTEDAEKLPKRKGEN
jgi:hypothetical protein